MSIDFQAIEAQVVRAASLPTRTDVVAACRSLAALTPADKILALRSFVERDRRRRAAGRSGDWVPHTFVQGAIGTHEVLPWTRSDVDFILDAIVEETGCLPPALAVRAVRQFTAGHELDASLRRAIARTARAMWPDDDGEGVPFRDAAAALRTLIGAPVGAAGKRGRVVPGRAAKKAASSATKAAPSAPRTKQARPRAAPARASFAELVKRHMKEACPSYRYVSTGGGSGPLVTFERPTSKQRPHLQQQVVFQKGLHGASWFRVNLFAMVTATGANGPMPHTVLEGASLGKDVRFATTAELDAALGAACAGLERGAAAAFARVERRYPRARPPVLHPGGRVHPLPGHRRRSPGAGRLSRHRGQQPADDQGVRRVRPFPDPAQADAGRPSDRSDHAALALLAPRTADAGDGLPQGRVLRLHAVRCVRHARARPAGGAQAPLGSGTHHAFVCKKH
jgi:hypothetical protein